MLLALTVMLSAAIVDQSRAQKVAENYYKNYAPSSENDNVVREILTKEYLGQPTWYAFNFEKGFVIVSAEDDVRAILGYSFTGEVRDINNMDNPFAQRFSIYDRQIVHSVREDGFVDTEAPKEWKDIENNIFPSTSKATVGPLVESTFGQGWPWNDQCPVDGGGATVVGCVATAMHQIMRYHQGPTGGSGNSSYWWTGGDGGTAQTLAVDYSAATYDYGLMPLDGNTGSQAEIDALAQLSYHCGVAVEMVYASSGSGAFSSDVEYALETYFGFMTQTAYASFGTIIDETTFAATLTSNIDNGLPVYWAGQGAGGGHAFVLDGYTDNYYYHFNWGWSGSADGWFQLNNLNPGGENYTDAQQSVYNIDIDSNLDLWDAPTAVNGSIANGDDVTINWTAPNDPPSATLEGYNVYRDGVLLGSTGVGTTTYDDNDRSEGNYNYTVKGVYTSPDGLSPVSNTYVAAVVADENYPVARFLDASVVDYTRQQVDVVWTAPNTATILYQEGFEGNEFETEWLVYRTTDNPPTGRKISGQIDSFENNGISVDDWFHGDAASFGGDDPQYVHGGLYYAGQGYHSADNDNYGWLFSPPIDLTTATNLKHWIWSYGTDAYPGNYYVYLYNGDFTENDPSANLTVIGTYENITDTNANTNEYDSEIDIPISVTGTYRLAFVRYNFGAGAGCYQSMVDDVSVEGSAKGSVAALVNPNPVHIKKGEAPKTRVGDIDTSLLRDMPSAKSAKADPPLSYDIYRNGSYVANTLVGTETYADTGFADGINEYFIKAQYTGGFESIACERDDAYMNANPAPDYLTGILNGAQADLSWYAPYGSPPMWFAYIEELDSVWDTIPGMLKLADRTRFLGSEMGFFYPCSLDSVTVSFYDFDEADWAGDNTFDIEVFTRNTQNTADSSLWTATGQTAVHDTWSTFGFPTMTMNWSWYVKITPVNTTLGHPAILADTMEDGGGGHSTSELDVAGDWYGITSDGDPMEWAIMSFITSAAPPVVTKGAWVGGTDREQSESVVVKNAQIERIQSDNVIKSAKGQTNYNIYRNGFLYDTSIIATYSDMSPVGGDNTYYVTSLYESPVGESVGTNSVIVTMSGLEAPSNVVTSISGSDVVIDWDVVAGATGYVIYSSADPYGTFSIADTVGTNSWSTPTTATKMFYYIIATDAKTVVHKTIEVRRSNR